MYVFEKAFDEDGNVLKEKKYPNKIQVWVTKYYWTSASYVQYNDIVGLWDSSGLSFDYVGSNNGWMIFKLDLGLMGGRSFLYVYHDYSKIRVAMSYYHGQYYQYRKFIEGEDINTIPTR